MTHLVSGNVEAAQRTLPAHNQSAERKNKSRNRSATFPGCRRGGAEPEIVAVKHIRRSSMIFAFGMAIAEHRFLPERCAHRRHSERSIKVVHMFHHINDTPIRVPQARIQIEVIAWQQGPPMDLPIL